MPISLETVGYLIAFLVLILAIIAWKVRQWMQEVKMSISELGREDIKKMITEKYGKERDVMFERLIEKTELSSRIQDIRGILKDVDASSEKAEAAINSSVQKLNKIDREMAGIDSDISDVMEEVSEGFDGMEDDIDWIKSYLEKRKSEREQRSSLIG